jgi:hypothetical protein
VHGGLGPDVEISVDNFGSVLERVDANLLCNGFDPENDPWDRRLLYEVTGMRLDERDYRGDDTSSDDENEDS